jgi:hypothetical protein
MERRGSARRAFLSGSGVIQQREPFPQRTWTDRHPKAAASLARPPESWHGPTAARASASHATRYGAASSLGQRAHCSYRVRGAAGSATSPDQGVQRATRGAEHAVAPEREDARQGFMAGWRSIWTTGWHTTSCMDRHSGLRSGTSVASRLTPSSLGGSTASSRGGLSRPLRSALALTGDEGELHGPGGRRARGTSGACQAPPRVDLGVDPRPSRGLRSPRI